MQTSNYNRSIGQKSEELALSYLKKRGFKLQEKNYRFKKIEIDLIVSNDSLMLFVEVKFRRSSKFGFPEEFVSQAQKDRIIEGADHYIEENSWEGLIRFDIISINRHLEIKHFEDAFY